MARSGRKRKFEGYLASDTSQARQERTDDRVRTSRQPHRRAIHEHDRLAQEAESPIGRMLLKGQLDRKSDHTGEEPRDRYNAASLYAAAVGAYRSSIGAPVSTGGSGRGYPCEPVGCAIDSSGCECLLRRVKYNLAYEALAKAGRRAIWAVNEAVVHRRAVDPVMMPYVVAGLDELVTHFGLMRKRQRQREAAEAS